MAQDPSAGAVTLETSSGSNNDDDDAATPTNSHINHLVVHILGGGLAGLACAAALRNMAHVSNVTVLEAMNASQYYYDTSTNNNDDDNHNTSWTVGAVAKVTPNGFRALAAIDSTLPHKVIQAGTKLTGVAFLAPDGQTIQRRLPDNPEPTTGWPQVLVRWCVLRQLLRDLIPTESIVTGVGRSVCGYVVQPVTGTVQLVNEAGEPVRLDHQPEEDSTATATTTTTDGQTILPHLIVAADGVHSPFQSLVRRHATILRGPDAPAIRKSNVHDNGRVNVNAVTQNPTGLLQLPNVPPGTALAYHAPTFTWFSAAAGPGYTSWALSVADHVDETGSRRRYFLRCNETTPEYLPAIHQFLQELLRQHAATPLWMHELVAHTPPHALFVRRSLQLTVVGPTFVSPDAHVVLVGDAAHACAPSYGQNTSFALEDAVVLALAVRQYYCSSNNKNNNDNNNNRLAQALHAYSDLRVHRCEEMFRRAAVRVHQQQQQMGQQQQQTTTTTNNNNNNNNQDDVLSWINGWVVPDRWQHEEVWNDNETNEPE